jgi:hypothetical protein
LLCGGTTTCAWKISWLNLVDGIKNEEITSMTLINANLQQAYTTFVSSIAKSNTDPLVLEEIYQEKLDRLDQYMDTLTQLAAAGMEEQLPPLLSTLLQEWAIKEAVELLLRYPGCTFNPADQDLGQSFWNKLGRQHQALSSTLLLHMQQGKESRAKAQKEHEQSWKTVAYKSLEDQRNQQQQWQNTAFQWVQGQQQLNQRWFDHQHTMFNQYQQANQKWADTALVGVQQAQLGIQQWYTFAAATQQNVANMLAGTEQRQSIMVEQAVQKANTKKWATRITILGLILVGIAATFGCAFFAMMHLY